MIYIMEVMKIKTHKYINLNNLPKYKGRINWSESVGKDVYFEYENIKGYVRIIEYDKYNQVLTIKYKCKIKN